MKRLHKFFVTIAFTGFAGAFFLAGTAANCTVEQIIPFGIISIIMMLVGLVGDLMVDGGVHRDRPM